MKRKIAIIFLIAVILSIFVLLKTNESARKERFITFTGNISLEGISFIFRNDIDAFGTCYRDDRFGIKDITFRSNVTIEHFRRTCNHEMLHFYLNNAWNDRTYIKEHEFIAEAIDYVKLPICEKLLGFIS